MVTGTAGRLRTCAEAVDVDRVVFQDAAEEVGLLVGQEGDHLVEPGDRFAGDGAVFG